MRLEAAARMDVFRKLWKARKLIVVVFIPLSLLPLPLIHPTSEACCAYVLMVTAVYWVSEAVPLGAAALVPAFLYPLFGVLKSSEVAAEYCKDTTLLLMGVICLAASIEKWNLHKRIALRMVMIAGAKPGMLVLGFMCCTVFLSMWLSNTSTTAMVMPIAEAVLQQLICTGLADSHDDSETAEAPEDDSGASGFVTSGGAVSDKEETLDKNQLELLYRNDSNDCTKRELSALSEVQTGEANGLGLQPISNQAYIRHTNGHLPQVAIEIPNVKRVKARRDSQYPTKRDHMICKCLSLSITYAATIGGLITITGTSTNLIFAEQFNNRYPDAKVINFGTWFIFSFPIAIIMLVLTWLWLHFLFLGCNFRETCSLSKKRKTRREMLSEIRIQEEYGKLGPISYPEVVTGVFFILMTLLWFTREPGFVPGWTSLFEKKGYRTDATVSVLLGFLLFLIPARRPFSSSSCRNPDDESESDPLAPMITWKDFQRLMPWEIVILVGGGYALAAGCKVSGLSVWIGRQLEPMSGLPPWAVTLLACLLVSAVTEFASNPATLTVFLPILSALSETLRINPLHTLIPSTMCVSFGVMLPVGNPPNAIVFSYGHVKISDMVKAGFGVNLIGVAVVMLAITTWGVPLFNLTEFPAWAEARNITGIL
ncbi:solute carrier family 13 member 4 isoform X1 [Epinephelus fuscoguttatus]|uniref:solute carrier family 13 member 4 isoform X1 n=1 Tax=Epinephelus fuscoguttatus TaxID=293821 RepID=UPI0020D0F279|nr:solute carrier family 13 member 4 isoform X1 [Epinephelus fuscoguttatus]XP_049892153.1 solute carrier family 13 member 4 isoform X1 [Epinephelus moara]